MTLLSQAPYGVKLALSSFFSGLSISGAGIYAVLSQIPGPGSIDLGNTGTIIAFLGVLIGGTGTAATAWKFVSDQSASKEIRESFEHMLLQQQIRIDKLEKEILRDQDHRHLSASVFMAVSSAAKALVASLTEEELNRGLNMFWADTIMNREWPPRYGVERSEEGDE